MDAKSLVIGGLFIGLVAFIVWYMTCKKCQEDTAAAVFKSS